MKVAAVPVKDLVNAKQRLVAVLTPVERMELARAMLRDVLDALAGAGFDALWVVTRDAEVGAIGRRVGAEIVGEDASRGHTAAVALAQAEAVRRRARLFLTVPGDVPCVTTAELERWSRRQRSARRRRCSRPPARDGARTVWRSPHLTSCPWYSASPRSTTISPPLAGLG